MIAGAAINAAAILIGGTAGILLKGKIKEDFATNIMKVIGLCVMVIGISGAVHGDMMLLVISLAAGTFVGEVLYIDSGLNRFGLWVQNKMEAKNKSENSTFAEGFVGASLLFCVGAMAIVGSISSGLEGDLSIIITKSIIDAVTAMILASSFGVGVLFSAVMVFLYQGSIELFARFLQYVLTPELIVQISAVGGVMILAIGANMTLGMRIKIANSLPGFLIAVVYYYVVL